MSEVMTENWIVYKSSDFSPQKYVFANELRFCYQFECCLCCLSLSSGGQTVIAKPNSTNDRIVSLGLRSCRFCWVTVSPLNTSKANDYSFITSVIVNIKRMSPPFAQHITAQHITLRTPVSALTLCRAVASSAASAVRYGLSVVDIIQMCRREVQFIACDCRHLY